MFDIRYTNDIVLLIWIGIAALLSKSVTKKKVTVLGQEEERYSFLFAVIVFFLFFGSHHLLQCVEIWALIERDLKPLRCR